MAVDNILNKIHDNNLKKKIVKRYQAMKNWMMLRF